MSGLHGLRGHLNALVYSVKIRDVIHLKQRITDPCCSPQGPRGVGKSLHLTLRHEGNTSNMSSLHKDRNKKGIVFLVKF